MLPGITGHHKRNRGGLVVGYLRMRGTRRGWRRKGSKERRGVAEMRIYIPPWAVLLSQCHPCHPPHLEYWGRYPPLYPAPPPLGLGLHFTLPVHVPAMCTLLRHANESDVDAHEGAREFRESRWRQAVMANMAKWGFGEASGARGILARLGFFCMAGGHTIMDDSLSRLVRLLELTSAISPAWDRSSESGRSSG